MGRKKLKRRDKPITGEKTALSQNVVSPGLRAAIDMASFQYRQEREARHVLAVEKEVLRMQREYTESVANWFYGLLALALHDEGWGAKRICRVLDRIRDYHREYNDPDFGDLDLWQLVRDEVGLDFDPGSAEVKKWEEIRAERERGKAETAEKVV